MPAYHGTFTPNPRSVSLARAAVGRFARMCGFSIDQVFDIREATGEALVAAVEHSGALRHGGGFSVYCQFEEGELMIEVQESGGSHNMVTNAFGTIIMRSLMNEVRYSQGGKRVRLMKKLE